MNRTQDIKCNNFINKYNNPKYYYYSNKNKNKNKLNNIIYTVSRSILSYECSNNMNKNIQKIQPEIYYLSDSEIHLSKINICWICSSKLDNNEICPECGYY